MIVAWTVSGNKALMGEVIETGDNYYTVKVTSYSHRSGAKMVGKKVMVKKSVAQIQK